MAKHASKQHSRKARAPQQAAADRSSAAALPGLSPALQRRVVVEHIRPQVDAGRFPIKRVPGERVTVSADVFVDGHDALSAVVLYRKAGESAWREVPMAPAGNDRWQA